MARAITTDPLQRERPTTANRYFYLCPLAIDYRLAGVSRFYCRVNHACVPARSAYCPIHCIPVVDAQQVMAAATLGHVTVVGVSSGVKAVVAALSDHPV